ncbi:hypothetical protein C0992_005682 [Termitomyces sp. T32_za158]|nr:hypothetical protein C0992_005682 [Termitomyces sp. T32_za158]
MAVYNAQTGIQTFYDDLVSHAQNIAVYLDEFTIRKTFLDGIPAEMRHALIHDDNLLPDVNTMIKFLVYAIHYEQSAWTASYYDQRSSHHAHGTHQPVKVGMFLAKRFKMEQNLNLWFVVQHILPAGHRPGLGPPDNTPVVKDAWYTGQPGSKTIRDVPPRVGPPKAAFGSSDASYRPTMGYL